MSFGFGVGDFLAVFQLANMIRKGFADAPSQFKAISDEVRSLSIVLLDVDTSLSERELDDEQEAELGEIAKGCKNVLTELEETLKGYEELKQTYGSVGKRAKRVWKRLKWEPEDIRDLRRRITTNIGLLNAFTSRLTREQVLTLVRVQEDQGRRAILDWITPIDYANQQSDFVARQQPGTGQWLLESEKFKTWLQTGKQTLFCPGIPGAGKTILTSIVVEELNTIHENNASIAIAYLYCNFRREHEQKLEDLLSTLLKQLVQEQPDIPDSVKSLYERHKDKRTRPSAEEIQVVLQTLSAKFSRTFIIIDALDECQISSGCRQKFLSILFDIQAKCSANLFATARPISSIEEAFKGHESLEIRASEEDVRRYLDGHMFRLPGFVIRNIGLQEEIKSGIIKAVDGMFLLAQLHLESLTGKMSPKAVRTALKNLATGSKAYNNAYADAMKRINGQVEDQAELAKQILGWITCALRPLKTVELQHAIAVEIGEAQLDEDNLPQVEDMISACVGLVTVDGESGIIRLVHYTTQEYFERTHREYFPDAEINITAICVTYLSSNIFERGYLSEWGYEEEYKKKLWWSNPLFGYAAENWGYHAGKASPLTHELSQKIVSFLMSKKILYTSSQHVFDWDNWYPLESGRPSVTGLHLVSYFGVEELSKLLLDTGLFEANIQNAWMRTPLWVAAKQGHEAVVKLLLDTGEVDVNSSDCYGRTALWVASQKGHEVVVKLLLVTNKVNINSPDNWKQTPLHIAAENGHEAIVKLLLDTGELEVSSPDYRGETALYIAAREGYEGVVRLLIKAGEFEVNSYNPAGWTALRAAACYGHEAIVKLVLDTGVDINSSNPAGREVLHVAVCNGHEAVVKLLLDTGVDVSPSDSDGSTELRSAAFNGHEAIIKLLIDAGVDVNSSCEGWTALHIAAWRGYEAIVKLLLNAGADVNSSDVYGRTVLLAAADEGQEATIKILLDNGADPNPTCSDNLNPLLIARKRGHEGTVNLLQQHIG